ncbi:tetratricopeptide repeat protein [Methylocystis sp.]|jgi:tetratricopeptide (TPR) repeat protein|uniref:tetratricopeptide repeat protein n=1 Tax=Methylocystis sp. TaxID=1911079 RepID=UPI003DA38CCC
MRYWFSIAAVILSAWLTPPALAADRDLHDCKTNLTIAACSRVIESGTGDAQVYSSRAVAYMKKKAWSLAIADITEAIRLNPEYFGHYLMRGDFRTRNGDYDLAIADLTKSIRLHQSDMKSGKVSVKTDSGFDYLLRGKAYHAKGDYDRAIADQTAAIQRSPKWTSPYEDRSKAYKAKGDDARALADHKEALRLDPKLGR